MTASSANFQSKLQIPAGSPSSFVRLLHWLLQKAWYVHSSSHIHIALSPSLTYQVLETAARPSVERLGLRKLFNKGRRYFIRTKNDGGFQMTTTSKVWWHPKRRTHPTAILSADFEAIDETVNRIRIDSHAKIRYLLGQFIWPGLITSIIIFLDWSPLLIALCILGLYGFSWSAYRLTAMLEVHEIIFFIETVLDNFAPEAPQQITGGDADITVDDFTSEWDRYVEEKRG